MYWYCHEASSWKKKWSRVCVTWLSHNNERFMSLFGSSLLTALYRGKEFQTTRFSRRVRKILGRLSTFFDWLWKAFIRQYLNWKRCTQMINEYHWSYQVTNDSICDVLCWIILYHVANVLNLLLHVVSYSSLTSTKVQPNAMVAYKPSAMIWCVVYWNVKQKF